MDNVLQALEDLQEKINSLIKEISVDYTLRLRVTPTGTLEVYYDKDRVIAQITKDGRCYFMGSTDMMLNYEEWLEADVDSVYQKGDVIWNGYNAYIDAYYSLIIKGYRVFEFDEGRICTNVGIPEIIKYPNIDTPKLFFK